LIDRHGEHKGRRKFAELGDMTGRAAVDGVKAKARAQQRLNKRENGKVK